MELDSENSTSLKAGCKHTAEAALPCEELLQLPWEYKVKHKAIVTNKEGGDAGGSK